MPLAQIIRQRDRNTSLPYIPNPQFITYPERQTWWDSLPLWERRLIASFAALVGVSLVTYVIYLYAKRQARIARADKEQTASFGNDKYATWAKHFKQAFENDGWWGTDVPLVRSTMRSIPTKEDFEKVVKSYGRMTKGSNLITDMSEELTRMEYKEMLAIKNAKPLDAKDKKTPRYDPKSLAKRFHAAISYTWFGFLPGTDDEAIKAVFQDIPSRKVFNDTAVAYRGEYGSSLREDLDNDLEWSIDWRALLYKKPAK